MPSDIATVIRRGSGGRRATSAKQALASAQKATKGVRVGRPLTYSPQLCERAVALGTKGKSWAAIARAFNISRSTLNEWERVYPEFADALARARAAAQAWWEDHGQRNLKADRYQAQVHKNIMAAQFEDYREQRQGVDITLNLANLVESSLGELAKPIEAKVIDGASSLPAPSESPKRGK